VCGYRRLRSAGNASAHFVRIVYLTNAVLPSRAANGVHIIKMCAALAANGHEVTLVAPAGADSERGADGDLYEFYGVTRSFAIARLPRRGGTLGEYRYAWACRSVAQRLRPDLVFSRYLLGSAAVALKGVPCGLELHQLLPTGSRLQSRIFRWLVAHPAFRRLVVITQPLRDLFVEAGVPPEKIHVAPDGADVPKSGVVPWPRVASRLQIGYTGHLYHGRGVEIILALAQRCPWADIHIVGGTEFDIARVRSAAASVANVTVHGFVPPADAERMRMGMDILLAPYQRVVGLGSGAVTTEKWMSPLKVFEYMAAGKAIVCSDLNILREVLTHNETALMCAPDDVVEWVAAITRLRDDEPLRVRLGLQARALLDARYQWRERAAKILRALEPAERGD
jgi:glycosyltransferase involved in cell wall biosynthesis